MYNSPLHSSPGCESVPGGHHSFIKVFLIVDWESLAVTCLQAVVVSWADRTEYTRTVESSLVLEGQEKPSSSKTVIPVENRS